MTTTDFLVKLVGRSGRNLQGLYDPEEVLRALLPSANIYVSRKTAVHIINGRKPLSSKYTDMYLEADGLAKLTDDISYFLTYYHSEALLLQIYVDIHQAVNVSGISQDLLDGLIQLYRHDPTLAEMGTYFAHVLHALLCS